MNSCQRRINSMLYPLTPNRISPLMDFKSIIIILVISQLLIYSGLTLFVVHSGNTATRCLLEGSYWITSCELLKCDHVQ